MTDREWAIQVDDPQTVAQLRTALNVFELHQRRAETGTRDTLEFLVDRFAGLRVEVFAREHSPPHFRVSVNGETANYRISDCAQLNGGLRRYYSEVRGWHADAENKQMLIKAWNRLRPTDCPVGEYQGG